MKGTKLLFGILFVCVALTGATADDDVAARAATRHNSGTTTSSATGRQKPTATVEAPQNTRTPGTVTRTVSPAKPGANTTPAAAARTISARTTTTPVESTRTQTDTAPRAQNVTARPENKSVRTQARTSQPAGTTRNAVTTRTATTPRTGVMRTANTAARSAVSSRARVSANVARAALNSELRDAVMGRNYSSCRQVYYDCMDEFCANKDTQLKRCACSSRIHEFDRVKQQLDAVEDKMLDFSQRLLTVNMDKEDVAAMNTATEGELAFNTQDKSDSKKILDEITKKLKANSGDSFNQSLTSITLSLNMDAAFDNVDSLMGASTTTKEGTALYNAALPICREMAMEICDSDSLSLAESGYQMSIEQDCNTVAKAYDSKTDQAREKIREGSALLDISRLDIHQKRNSDDVLACKKKMLAQLTDTTVCGTDLEKCLDMSGRYIDPSTGQAFLSTELANLSLLLTRPSGTQTWTSVPGNDRFVSYLYSKKQYLDTATENCQDIADTVWDEFIDDALAQIKLAQDKKLEEVRQSCTTLTAQCLSEKFDALTEFDSRALSTFGVAADITANAMCESVKTACTALMESIGDTGDWNTGMSMIATDKSYDTILQTCREVGRACIIQACKSVSGNFGLCNDIQNSVNRKAIIGRTSCWNDVVECVGNAGVDTIDRIYGQGITNDWFKTDAFFNDVYGANKNWHLTNGMPGVSVVSYARGTSSNTCSPDSDITKQPDNFGCIYDICYNECGIGETDQTKQKSLECRKCRIAERIWGNCEFDPLTRLSNNDSHNRIIIPTNSNTSTLLSWFATNTNTQAEPDNCRDTTCPPGTVATLVGNQIVCTDQISTDDDGKYCPNNIMNIGTTSDGQKDRRLCCDPDNGYTKKGKSGNICIQDRDPKEIETRYNNSTVLAPDEDMKTINLGKIYTNATDNQATIVAVFTTKENTTLALVCLSENNETQPVTFDRNGEEGKIECKGRFVYVDSNQHYIDPHGTEEFSYFPDENGIKYRYSTDGQWWNYDNNGNKNSPLPNRTGWFMKLPDIPN